MQSSTDQASYAAQRQITVAQGYVIYDRFMVTKIQCSSSPVVFVVDIKDPSREEYVIKYLGLKG